MALQDAPTHPGAADGEGPQSSVELESGDAHRITQASRWAPAMDIVQSAATKIALYEKGFLLLDEEARRTAAEARAERIALVRKISELKSQLAESEANYQKTLRLLHGSQKICWLQKMHLKELAEALVEAERTVNKSTAYIAKLGLLMLRATR